MKIHEYNEMMSYLTRPAVNRTGFNQGTKKVAALVDDLEPGSLKDELLKDFDPSQETYEEYLRRKALERQTSAQGGVIGKGGMFQGEDMGYRTGFGSKPGKKQRLGKPNKPIASPFRIYSIPGGGEAKVITKEEFIKHDTKEKGSVH